MASFDKAMGIINNFSISNQDYLGIQRKFFPKWEGWVIVDNNCRPPDKVINDFYYGFFWDKLNCSIIVSQHIAELIFLFSITNGKRKTIDKLDRIFSTNSNGIMSSELITLINSSDTKFIFMYLYAEFCEFCIMLDKKKDFYKLLKVYNSFISNLD